MKLLFVHGSEKIKQDNEGNLYNSGSYNEAVWNQYTSVFEKVTLLARKESYIYEESDARNNFNFFDHKKIDLIQLLDPYSSIREFLSISQKRNNDAVIKNAVLENDYIIARLPSPAGNKAIDYAKKFNKPYLIEVVGCVWDSLWNHSYKGKILAPISYLQMRNRVKDSKNTLYVTKFFLQKRYPTSGNTIACSDVQIKNLNEQIITSRIDKINIMDIQEKNILGTLGAIDVKYKGHENVIKALGILKKKGASQFEYQIVGSGNPSYLKKICEKYDVVDQVRFVGSLPHPKVFEWLDSVDIYIQPSKTEGLPRSVIEAMSRAVPVMGSDVGGIPELVNKKYLFDAYSVEEIALLLNQMDKKELLSEAKRSFNKSKDYDKRHLNNLRENFYRKFSTIN